MEAELLQQTKRFEEVEAELTGDVLDAYDTRFGDALAQVACAHPGMDTTPFTTSNRVVNGKSFSGSFLNLYLLVGQTIYYLLKTLLSRTYSCFHFLKSKNAL